MVSITDNSKQGRKFIDLKVGDIFYCSEYPKRLLIKIIPVVAIDPDIESFGGYYENYISRNEVGNCISIGDGDLCRLSPDKLVREVDASITTIDTQIIELN